MENMCIIISSDYSGVLRKEPDAALWQSEVETDRATVVEQLQGTHRIYQMSVDILSTDNKDYQREILRQLTHGFLGQGIPKYCHIVLNTHGKKRHDLDDEIIKELIEFLSSKSVNITQISVLVCNAFRGNAIRGYEKTSMDILQHKLQALELPMAQKFALVGFNRAYNPTDDKNAVMSVLGGDSSMSGGNLDVEMKLENVNDIQSAVDMYKKAVDEGDIKSKTLTLNVFSKEINRRIENIYGFLQSDSSEPLTPRSQRLFQAVTSQPDGIRPTSKEFHKLHRIWTKENRMITKIGIFSDKFTDDSGKPSDDSTGLKNG